jgi:hypothetical protein
MSRDAATKIAKDGLRYKSKEGGSPYGPGGTMGTMSCYKCGLHKPRALGTFKPESDFGQCFPQGYACCIELENNNL